MKKTTILTVALIFLFSLSLFAQETDLLEKQVQKLKKELQLTDEQTGQIKEILQTERAEMRQEREQSPRSKPPKREDIEASKTFVDARISNILTDEQFKKYQEMKKDMVTDVQTLRLAKQLNLSEMQARQMQKVLLARREKMDKLRNENTGDRRKMREQNMKLMQQSEKAVEKILTPEQLKKYRELQKERRQKMMENRPGMRERKK